ncbi:MAG: DoxX family protein [Betaproteobacteria bacterium]
MRAFQTEDIGKLVLRLTLGVLLLFHGVAKIFSGVSGISGMLQGLGLPGFIAYGAYVGEIVAPLLVVIGWYARVGALVIVLNMLAAITLAHQSDLFTLGRGGAWALELQAFFLFTALALALIGPGRFSVKEN